MTPRQRARRFLTDAGSATAKVGQPAGHGGDGLDQDAQHPGTTYRAARLVGLSAVAFSALYLISDMIETAQGDFTTARLVLTYLGEAAIPLFVIGLYAVQRPRIGSLGLFGAVAYAYSYVFFTGTVVYALAAGTPNWNTLTKEFGPWLVLHGVIMVVGGAAFGWAVVRAGALPRWTGICLIIGVVAVAAADGSSALVRTIAEAVPAAAFAGMGVALWLERPTVRPAKS